MKRRIPLILCGILLAGCSDVPHGTVTDKRAPGPLGDKTFQIQIDSHQWWSVSERAWTSCGLGMVYPSCAAAPTPAGAPHVKTKPVKPPQRGKAPRSRR
jgi:hypothetical protein